MFPDLRLEVMDRFTAVEHFFRATRRFRGEASQTAKGLVFVQVYGIHEFTVNSVVRIAVREISSHAHLHAQLKPSLLTLFLDSDFTSTRDCSPKRVWEQRLLLLERAGSTLPVKLTGEPPIPADGSHYRHSHVRLILKVFGISKRPTRRRRHLYRIDEVVEKRNLIAHGEEPAGDVGRRYSRAEIRGMMKQMKSSCLTLIRVFEEYCLDPSAHRR